MKQFVRYITFFFAWLFFATLGYGIGYLVFDQAHVIRLAEDGIEAYGKVTSKEPDNHRAIRYTYVVDGHEYSGSGAAGRGNENFDEIGIGESVVIFYDPVNPADSFLGYPQGLADSQDTLIIIISISLSVIAPALLFRFRRRRLQN